MLEPPRRESRRGAIESEFNPFGNPWRVRLIQGWYYITDTLTRLVNGWPQDRIDELMPWHWTLSNLI